MAKDYRDDTGELKVQTLLHLGLIIEPDNTDPDSREERALWFLSLCDADGMSEYTFKDRARLINDGIPPIKERWREVLETLGSEEDENGECFPTISEVRDHARDYGWRV